MLITRRSLVWLSEVKKRDKYQWPHNMSGVLCHALTLKRNKTLPQLSRSICYTPLSRLSRHTDRLDVRSHLPHRRDTFCLFSDATVHPPASKTHPYENQDPARMPPDIGYGCKMVNGVMHVYTTRSSMDKYDTFIDHLVLIIWFHMGF